ncbi:hypothetical protein GH714_021126 [Hevea brasiliensis]|uniref:Heparanase-like protein 1 n=1 Tax=Hevea brasiliensis TaxID=3981 RepID=A0A6A6MGW2_HEVBR|nr:hypothetical protein GH714_021126 [Hevea brasiliensis]
MGFCLSFLFFLASIPIIFAQDVKYGTIVVDGTMTVAETDDNFICATLDWWPHDKCDYNQCPWHNSSVINLDLSHPFLAKAIQAFRHLRLRIGGSLQDQVLYEVGNLKSPCHPFRKMKDGLFGFSKGCLRLDRWDELNHFFSRTGAIVTFSLNALHGRHQIRRGVWGGAWDSSNAYDFMNYTISKGHKIDSWEFGNELSGSGVGASNGPWASAWVGESGGAYNSGGRHVSNTFINSFWYLDQLGMGAKYHTKVYCRQTLIGGNYGLLNTTTFVPNPDYYSALLWHRLMGKGVLPVGSDASPYLRAYAHCSKGRAGVTLLLINLSNQTDFIISVRNNLTLRLHVEKKIQRESSFMHVLKRSLSWVGNEASDGATREEYHLTPKDGYLQSQTMVLNGIPLELTENGDIPRLDPVHNNVNSPIYISPLSITFIVFPNFDAPPLSRGFGPVGTRRFSALNLDHSHVSLPLPENNESSCDDVGDDSDYELN